MSAFSDEIYRVSNMLGIGFVALFLNREKILVLMYHGVVSENCPIDAWTLVRENEFRNQMNILAKWYDVVNIESIVHHGHLIQETCRPRAVITFDDGYKNNYTTALPILEEYGFPATIFICSGFLNKMEMAWYDKVIYAVQRSYCSYLKVDATMYFFHASDKVKRWDSIQTLLGYLKTIEASEREAFVEGILEKLKPPFDLSDIFHFLSYDDVRALHESGLITVGAHTARHEILPQLSIEKAMATIQESLNELEGIIGKPIHAFSYPNGNFNNEIMKCLSLLGVHSAVTTFSDLYSTKYRPLEIPRIGIGGYDSIDRFIMKSSDFRIRRSFMR
jgi:peptidoglycan/xylan/chitin deacetylase (PgdA/CDA1 family)